MKLNTRGEWCSSGDGAWYYEASRDEYRQIYTGQGGGIQWLTDDRLVMARSHFPGQAEPVLNRFATDVYNRQTGEWSTHYDFPNTTGGFNQMVAGGGQLMARLGDLVYGTRTWPAHAVPVSAANDGTIAYVPDGRTGVDLAVRDPFGVTKFFVNGQPVQYNCRALGSGEAWFSPTIAHGILQTLAGRHIKQASPEYSGWGGANLLSLPDGAWQYVGRVPGMGEIVIHPALEPDDPTPLTGFVLTAGDAFFVDSCVLPGTSMIRVRWTITEGDVAVNVRVADLDPLTGLGRIWRLTTGWEAMAWPRVPISGAIPIPPIAPIRHAATVRPFKDPANESGGDGDIEQFGVFCEGPLVEIPPALIALAEAKQQRIVWTRDAPDVLPVPSNLRPFDIPLVELYPVKGDDPDGGDDDTVPTATARWTREILATLDAWPGDVGIIPMFYAQGGAPPQERWPVEKVLAFAAAGCALANLSARIKVIAPFCYRRANGMTAHPELLALFHRLCAAVADHQPVLEDPVPHEVTSEDGRFRFIAQNDGNLVLYGPKDAQHPSGVWWASGTNEEPSMPPPEPSDA